MTTRNNHYGLFRLLPVLTLRDKMELDTSMVSKKNDLFLKAHYDTKML